MSGRLLRLATVWLCINLLAACAPAPAASPTAAPAKPAESKPTSAPAAPAAAPQPTAAAQAKPADAKPTAAAAAPAKPAGGVTELTFFYPVAVGGPITKIVDGYVEEFNKANPDVKVTSVFSEDSDRDRWRRQPAPGRCAPEHRPVHPGGCRRHRAA
jgi:ABC-type glycerol-3-phosphate transport system substrate-binding protein